MCFSISVLPHPTWLCHSQFPPLSPLHPLCFHQAKAEKYLTLALVHMVCEVGALGVGAWLMRMEIIFPSLECWPPVGAAQIFSDTMYYDELWGLKLMQEKGSGGIFSGGGVV
jgi:hypothetical protein